ncbi:hypothetical protein GDO81_022582 [Engystomops pustulosus]|uniref:Uncharacterized protein n=1 Tax=Engystomops pustulosus TaxID=76066 RepID=A0AAV6YWX8_ENGPU|nr:hypothetical protein GDO81_022582 [Engystomops pustulosus]
MGHIFIQQIYQTQETCQIFKTLFLNSKVLLIFIEIEDLNVLSHYHRNWIDVIKYEECYNGLNISLVCQNGWRFGSLTDAVTGRLKLKLPYRSHHCPAMPTFRKRVLRGRKLSNMAEMQFLTCLSSR